MDKALYFLARGVIAVIQALPLTLVARLGRFLGGLVYLIDGRHRRVAIRNLTMCFRNEKSADEIRALARENFRRIGENFACAAKTAGMTFEQLKPHVEFIAPQEPFFPPPGIKPPSIVAAIGHFGNFE